MNHHEKEHDESDASESESIRSVQELIDQASDSTTASEGLYDSDTDHCIKLFKTPRSVAIHLLGIAPDLPVLPSDSDSAQSESGTTVQNWTLQFLRVLGSGGFAVVLAVQRLPDLRIFAMKFLRPSLRWSQSHQKRFLREAELTSLLDHPGIVPVFGTGLLGASPFILSEYVNGPNLAEYLAKFGPTLDVETSVSWVQSLAKALQLAHESGILHRDLKPENILLQSASGRQSLIPRITDFGLARRTDQSSFPLNATSTANVLIGTARYMAPEVAAGRHLTGSVTADVYSLAAIMFQCLTGRVPFEGNGYIQIVTRMQSAPAPLAHRLNPNVPASVSLVLQKALCRAPHLRYQSAGELAADLERAQLGRSVEARQFRLMRTLWDLSSSHPRVSTAVLVAVLIVPLALVAISILYYRERSALEQHRSLLQSTMNSVSDYINLSENVLDKIPASVNQRYELLQKALAAQQLVAQGLDNNAASRYRMSVLYSLLAAAAWKKSDTPLSLEHTHSCLDMLQQLRQDDPSNIHYQYDVFYNRMCLENRFPFATNAERIVAKEATLREIQELNRISPGNPDYIDALSSSYFSLGQALVYIKNPDCRSYLLKSIEISDQLWKQHPEKLLFVKYCLIGRSELADDYRQNGDLAGSLQQCEAALAISREIVHLDRSQPWFLESIWPLHRSFACTLREQKKWREAEVAFHECVVLQDQLFQHNPNHTPYGLYRAIFAAEELRAARKAGSSPGKEAELLQAAGVRLEELRRSGTWADYIPRIEALIANPDHPPVE